MVGPRRLLGLLLVFLLLDLLLVFLLLDLLSIGDLTNTKEDTLYTVSLKLCFHPTYAFYSPVKVCIIMPKDMDDEKLRDKLEDKEILRFKMFTGKYPNII